jgi:transglutaminase-like putative cysteine protease
MKKRILMLLLLCGALNLAAVETGSFPSVADLLRVAEPATLQLYPDADTVLVEDIVLLSYQADGSCAYTNDVAVKILTEKGREEENTVTIGYDAAYGSTRFLRAEVIKPDGTAVPVDLEKQTRETIDSGQMNANIYDPNSKQILLSVPNLETGDLLRYTFSGERTKAVVPDTWSDLFLFEDTSPILHSLCRVDAPSDRPLTRIELKDPVGDTVTYRRQKRPGGGIRHIWEARHVPQMFPEPEMPSRYTVSQRILLSTIPDWEALSEWYWKLSKPRLDAVNDAMKTKVKQLTAGLTDRQKKVETIFRFVSQDIRYMGITVEDEAPGYEPHDVCMTFDNRYGVCRDKAALLVSMLRLAGLDAYPVLIYVGPKKDPEVPQPWFNHAITAVRNEDGSWQLMDPTNENTRDLLPAYLCNRSYLVARPNGDPLRTSPVIPPEDNMLTIQIEGSLDDSNLISAEALLSFGGINDTAYRGRLAGLKPEEREPYFESRLKQALGAARLTGLEIFPANVRDTTVPLSVVLEFEVENAVVEGPAEAMLRVPTLINHFGLFGALLGEGTGLDRREYPLQTQITCGVSETVRLDLTPGSLRPVVLPRYDTVDNPRVFISRSVSATNGVIAATADLRLRTVEFSPEEYSELKENLKTAEYNARKRVILEPVGFPEEADFATLSEHIYYALYDPGHFMQIKTVKQKVLTYAGKRELSDVKISYNSGFQQVALRSARVIAPDGAVSEIDPEKEVNMMDAPWVSGAPRYPAEKIMVVSLPGVEVGSVIEYQVATAFRNVPFFSVMETFDSFNPVVEKTVQVELSPSVDLKIGNMAPGVIRRRTYHNNGTIVHEWSVKNRPMIRKEDHLIPDWILKPSLFLSAGAMDEYAETIRKELLAASKPQDAVKARAKELTRDVKGRVRKMTVLRDFVDRRIRPAGPGISSLPLSAITPAEQTLTEGYGNSTDRAVLLYALSDAAKLKPRFVLSSGLPQMEGVSDTVLATFQRQPFNVPLVAVEEDKTVWYFGDSGRYAVPGTLAHNRNPAIDLDTGELEIPRTSLTNRTDISFQLNIAENGDVTLVKVTKFSGTAFETFHKTFAEFTPEELRREQQRQLSSLSQSAEALRPLQPSFSEGTLTLAATLKNYAVLDGDRMYFTLPGGLDNLLDIRSDRRTGAFYIGDPIRSSRLYELILPKGWRPVMVPETFRTELPENGGTVRVQTAPSRDGLMILQEADIHPATIRVKDYDELLDLNDKLTRPAARTVMLEKIRKEPQFLR